MLERVIELEQTTSLKIFTKHLFSIPRKDSTQRMIMRNFQKMTELGVMKYMPEFVSNSEGGESLNIETLVQSEFLETYANSELEIF